MIHTSRQTGSQAITILFFLGAMMMGGVPAGEVALRAEYRSVPGRPGVQVESVATQSSFEISTDLIDMEIEVIDGRLTSATISAYRGPAGEVASLRHILDTIILRQSWEPIQSVKSTAGIRELKEALGTLLRRGGISLPDAK